ncbi:MAG: cytochrome c oxidase assembly factor Coa1 family protein [Thermogutta sp.]
MNDWRNETQSAPQQEGRAKSWVVRLAIVAVLILLAIAGLAVAGLMFLARLGGEPLHLALETLRKDQTVVSRLGEPIQMASWFPVGSVRVSGERGNANLTFRVKGSREQAVVNVVAQRIAGKWGLTTLEVKYSNGERQLVDLSEQGDKELEAPKWTPPAASPAVPQSPDQGDKPSPSEETPPNVSVPAPSVEIKIPEPPQK